MFGKSKMESFEVQAMAFLHSSTRGLAQHEMDIEIKHIPSKSSNSHLFEITVHKEDIGKMIGRSGKTASSLRMLLNNIAHKHKTTAVMEIIE